MKRLAYQTTDLLNEATVEEYTAECRGEMVPLSLHDPSPDSQFDAVLYDLDYLPAERREAILAELLAGRPHCRTGVHSFNLDDEQAEALARNGILVSRRLELDLIRALLR